jgi:hypothetical protein
MCHRGLASAVVKFVTSSLNPWLPTAFGRARALVVGDVERDVIESGDAARTVPASSA